MHHIGRMAALLLLVTTLGCRTTRVESGDEHAGHAESATAPSADRVPAGLPPGNAEASVRITGSPRHAEWVTIATGVAPRDSLRAWVVYPQRRDKAPVVLVIHEIYGLTPWIRSVADQLAADGFIAIAPDLLTSKNIPGSPENPSPDSARAAIRTLDMTTVQRQLLAVAEYGMRLPAARARYGIVGFCWGGSTAFQHAAISSTLGAAVVYYGASPAAAQLANVRAPVLGLYGENDARVNATIAPADSALKALGRTFAHEVYAGAGHGFLRAQDGAGGANRKASEGAWPRTIEWFRRHLEK
jgi:carboxymethylenebutenolidase